MRPCAHCNGWVSSLGNPSTITVGTNPDETVGMYDFDFFLCENCQEIREEIGELEMLKRLDEKARQAALKEENILK